jgi:hypothetical protein
LENKRNGILAEKFAESIVYILLRKESI